MLLCSYLTSLRHLRATGELAAPDSRRVPHSQGLSGSDWGMKLCVESRYILFCYMMRMLMLIHSTNLHHRTKRSATWNWWSLTSSSSAITFTRQVLYVSRSADYDDITHLVWCVVPQGQYSVREWRLQKSWLRSKTKKVLQYNAAVTSDESSLMDTIPYHQCHHVKHTPTISIQEG